MITLQDLIGKEKVPPEHEANLEVLLFVLNRIEADFGLIKVTSGYRSMAHHLAIYAAKGITDQSKIPMKSHHLFGEAADIVPIGRPVNDLHDFIKANADKYVAWYEALESTPTWLHVQIVPPKSGKRFFKP